MWWTGSAVGLDFETDGPDPTDARIITAAIVHIGPGDPASSATEIMVKPERPIPEEAAAIHGISTERAEAEGMDREAAVRAVIDLLSLTGPDRPVVGHNVGGYDLTVLDREMRRLGVGCLSTHIDTGFVSLHIDGASIAHFPVIDTLVLDKAADRFRKGKRRLEVTAEHYGVPMAEGSAHGATADVFASLRIAFKIHQRCMAAADYIVQHPETPMAFVGGHPFMRHYAGRRDPLDLLRNFAAIGAYDLAELHAMQEHWAAQQAQGLREYFIKSGTGDPAGVSEDWPFRRLRADQTTETVSTAVL